MMLQSDEDLLLLLQRMQVWFSVFTCLFTTICNSGLQRIPCSLLTSAGTRCTHMTPIYKCRQTLRHIRQNQINLLTGVSMSLLSLLLCLFCHIPECSCFALLILFIPEVSACLLKRGRKGMDLDEGGGRDAVSVVEEQATVTRICYVRKNT